MKISACLTLLVFCPRLVLAAVDVDIPRTLNFDHDWQFRLGDASGAEQPAYDDSTWRKLDVPHDWSIAGPFSETNRTGGAGAFLPAGIGFYRKQFTLPDSAAGRRVSVEFDGVMANSDVWINGQLLGHRPNGYVSFAYDLTPFLRPAGGTNVLAVRADNSPQPASRWYTGAGIYRHVRLVVTDPIHLERWSTFASTPQVESNQATVHVKATVTNESNSPRPISVRFTLVDPRRRLTAEATAPEQTIAPGTAAIFAQDLVVKNPQRWDLDQPSLYQATAEVRDGKNALDDDTVRFGIRQAVFEANTGFWLNGRNFKIKGVCLHADGSAFGAAVPLAVWERRLAALKELGVNAIRTAHNPPAPDFLDLCDRMGFLVIDEFFDCWTVGKNPYDYHLYFTNWSQADARDTIRRDRNHPSIILYSVGNEIHDTPRAVLAIDILSGLVKVCHENDPTRPVTQALFRPNVSHDYDDGLADLLDVIGTNYRDSELLAAHDAKPSRKIIGTEQRHDRATWLACRDHPEHAGQFLWTGIDYLGESRRWPVIAAGSGLLDRTAVARPLGYERQSWWSDRPMVFIARRTAATETAPADPGFTPLDRRQGLYGDWTPADSGPHEEKLEVYSNCEQVELWLNGKSVGSKMLPSDASPRAWTVSFEPGTLKAVGRDHGKVSADFELRTAGKPAAIVLAADRPTLSSSWDDVAFVSATVVDDHGVVVPNAQDLITFHVSGPGAIAVVDSADNSSHEAFQASQRHAFQGRCFAMLKAAGVGRIILAASAPGLRETTVSVMAGAKALK
jgi:beta-galactosidase